MALIDVKKYYLNVQNQYFEMVREIADFEKEVKKGFIEEERIEGAKKILSRLKENYDRLSYIMMLLNKPKNKKRVKNFKAQNADLILYLDSSSQEKILDENTNVLVELKKYIRGENNAN